ncbi:Peroxin 13, N-terminal region-domain-containing protein [Dipodascopsis uninucleata]
MSVPRPKPWEQGRAPGISGGITDSAGRLGSSSSTTTNGGNFTGTMNNNNLNEKPSEGNTSSAAPSLPSRPPAVSGSTASGVNGSVPMTGTNNLYPTAATTSAFSPYGGTSAFSSFGSRPYGTFSSPYSSYSPYSSAYSPYGSSYPRIYSGTNPGGPIENSTAAAFQMLEAVVSAFGGFAQMLESTYMATHSSFFAMVGVAEQLTALRKSILGSASVGVFALWRFVSSILRRLTGRSSPAPKASDKINLREFDKHKRNGPAGSSGPASSRMSVMPLVIFLVAVFGGPYLMSKLIKSIARSHIQDEMKLSDRETAALSSGTLYGPQDEQGASMNDSLIIDPSKLEFCRALYDFKPENEAIELGLKKGEIIAILSKDSLGEGAEHEPTWWRGRLRNGQMGYFPSNYVEVIKRKPRAE